MHAAGRRGSHAAAAMRCGGGAAAGPRLFGVQLRAAATAAAGGGGSPALQLQKEGSSPAYALVAAPIFLSSSPSSALLLTIEECSGRAGDDGGYLSDDGGARGGAALRERKKGVPWSEEEHRLFLVGLEKLGKGDWRGISRSFVTSRTPTQVASHAQKFFLRQQSGSGKKNSKRRSSLFDMSSEAGRSAVADPSSCNGGSIDRTRPSSEAPVSEPVPAITEQAHEHHCSPLNLELGMSLSTPSIGT
ncbi:hypothetical protein ACP4OV_021432 [Aristida adscensionis]